ncbi:MAG TPA: beta-galactosidase, partial [Solirubrobacterales bacterium]|nr:beta-galactosidase [Solirubrobacterales bacterium]
MIATILALLTLATMPVAAPGYLPPGFVGISPQNSGTAKDYRLMREAGVQSVRLPLFWSGVEPQNPAFSERNWEGFDREVRLAAEAEIEVFPFITASPKWVTPLGIDL